MVAGGSVCDDGGVWCMVVENVVYGSGAVVVNHCHRQEVTLSSPPPLHELPPVSYK